MATSSAIPKAVLYYSPQSVWSSAILLALHEKGYGDDEVDLKVVDIGKGEEFSPTFLRLSPKAMVPTLVVPLRGSLASDVASRFKAISDTKALIEFLDKSRSASSHTHTTSSAPAPSLSPATVAFANASNKIINSIQADEVSPDNLLYLNARDRASLQELGKSLIPILESRRAAIVGYLTDCEHETMRMSEKTKAFWRDKQAEVETALSVFSANDVDGYLSRSRNMWEITIPSVLTRVNEELIGPYALGDQISIADIHLSAWLSHLVRLAGGSPSDDGDIAIKRVEKHIGNGFVFPEDFLSSAFSPFTEEKAVARSKLAAFWDAMKSRSSWNKVYVSVSFLQVASDVCTFSALFFLHKMNRSTTIITVASVAVSGILAYAVYFDYKRRTDANFRKQLRKEKKRVKQSQTPSESGQTATGGVDANDLRSALESVRGEEVPLGPEEKEQYFMKQVGIGEQLCAQGPVYQLPAALCFYRALRVYPSPVELIVIYEKTVPPPVFQLVMELTNLDVKDRVEGYYTFFPPKAMNVAVETVNVPDGKGGTMSKKVLVVTKDFKAGEVIYQEDPIVAVLDADLQGKGTHCSYCLRQIQNDPIRPESDRLHSVYCSSDCQTQHKAHSQTLLFTLESPLPAAMAPEMGGMTRENRENAQKAFVEYLIQTKKAAPELVARFVARQVSAETARMLPREMLPGVAPEPVLTDGGEYSLYDHLERLRYLEVNPADHETRVLKDVLQTALPGLEQFLTDERHATFIGKMSYNSYGVYFGEGREDKPETAARPENAEKTRTPCGTSKQIGTGFYAVSSYISHNCTPSAKPVFPTGTAQLQLMATCALQKGDEITVAYVDVSQHSGETVEVARRRRRMELVRGWRFACSCKRCAEEGLEGETEEGGDESRVEDVVTRAEGS